MLKKFIVLVVCFLLISGCNNKVEEEKNVYLDTKSILETTMEFTELAKLPCDITITTDRITGEKVTYKAVLSNPKENMNNVRLLLIHNQYTEEVFPSIGLMDSETVSLTKENDADEVIIDGSLDTTSDIKELALEFRIWLEYTDDNNETQTIYYKTTI